MDHKDILVGANSAHPLGYAQSSDPGVVGAYRPWVDTTTTPYVLKVRNAADTGWEVVGFAITPSASNGQSLQAKSLTELTTIVAAATTDTAIQFPAGCTRLGASVRVTVGITCTTTFDVGDSGNATRFASGVSKAANSTAKGNVTPYVDASALAVRITPDTTPTDATGRVRVTIYYLESTPPTS